jgi:hypothetical protein
MVRAELNLPRQIEHDIGLVSEFLQPFFQPVKVRFQMLETVKHSTIRTKSVLIHHILKSDELRDIDRTRIWQGVVRGVEIDDGYGTFECGKELMLPVAVCRLAASGGANYDFAERHDSRTRRKRVFKLRYNVIVNL